MMASSCGAKRSVGLLRDTQTALAKPLVSLGFFCKASKRVPAASAAIF